MDNKRFKIISGFSFGEGEVIFNLDDLIKVV